MTPEQLEKVAERLVQNRPPWFCVVEQETLPKLRKTNRETGEPCPYLKVRHLAVNQVVLGGCYEKQVNRQRQREDKTPDFRAEDLWEGKGYHVPGSPCLIGHTERDTKYIAYRLQRVDWDVYVVTHRDGQEALVSPEAVEEWLKDGGKNEKQGLDKAVEWRTVKLESLVNIRYGGGDV